MNVITVILLLLYSLLLLPPPFFSFIHSFFSLFFNLLLLLLFNSFPDFFFFSLVLVFPLHFPWLILKPLFRFPLVYAPPSPVGENLVVLKHLIIHFPTSSGVSEWTVRAIQRTDERVTQYLHLDSWLFRAIEPPPPIRHAHCLFFSGKKRLFWIILPLPSPHYPATPLLSMGVFDEGLGGGTCPPNCRALILVRPKIQKKMTTDLEKMKKDWERNPFLLIISARW